MFFVAIIVCNYCIVMPHQRSVGNNLTNKFSELEMAVARTLVKLKCFGMLPILKVQRSCFPLAEDNTLMLSMVYCCLSLSVSLCHSQCNIRPLGPCQNFHSAK